MNHAAQFRSLVSLVKSVLGVALLFGVGCSGGGSDNQSSQPLKTDSCGVLGVAKIINGTECAVKTSAIVRLTLVSQDNQFFLCTGTLLSPRHVLTAGHCLIDADGRVIVQAFVEVADDRSYNVTQAVLHPGYEYRPVNTKVKEAIFNDLAILELERDASAPTLPLLLSKPSARGDVVSIFGYGTDEQGQLGKLKSGEMRLTDVNADHLISAYEGQGSNTCFGDSGGPVIRQYLDANGKVVTGVVGVTSSGAFESNCLAGDLSYFANTQSESYRNFILQYAPDARLE